MGCLLKMQMKDPLKWTLWGQGKGNMYFQQAMILFLINLWKTLICRFVFFRTVGILLRYLSDIFLYGTKKSKMSLLICFSMVPQTKVRYHLNICYSFSHSTLHSFNSYRISLLHLQVIRLRQPIQHTKIPALLEPVFLVKINRKWSK